MNRNNNTNDYERIDKSNFTTKPLLDELKDKVLLVMEYCAVEHECRCHSYTYVHNRLQHYSPYHTLCVMDGLDDKFFDELEIDSEKKWFDVFLQDNSHITIDDEYYGEIETSSGEAEINKLLQQENNELYLSFDMGNFHGPLECFFVEWWIKNHPMYHTDTIRKI